MAYKLFFPHTLNVSVQPGDMIMYCTTTPKNINGKDFHQSGKNFTSIDMTRPKKFGYAVKVNHASKWVLVNNITPGVYPSSDDYIFFSKDRRANISGVVGYFAETKYVNDSKKQSEMFATAIDYVDSSS
tara:strand:- start:489 stop:875 length:387 start_codon:yes stop_codon:yes gene_type:complete